MDIVFGALAVLLGVVVGVFARKWQVAAMREKLEGYRTLYEEMCHAAGTTPTDPLRASVHRFRVFKRKNPLSKAVVVYDGDNGSAARRSFENEHLGGDEVVEIWDGKDMRGRRLE